MPAAAEGEFVGICDAPTDNYQPKIDQKIIYLCFFALQSDSLGLVFLSCGGKYV
jgi:hypothetical protein